MNENYRISDIYDEMDVAAVHAFLTRSYWAKSISLNTVDRAMQNSLCFGVFYQDQQVGFARVISDYATFAYLADVYILEPHRGKGLSKELTKTVLEHPKLQGLRRMLLATSDAHGLYAKFGFSEVEEPQLLMQIWNPDVYKIEEKT